MTTPKVNLRRETLNLRIKAEDRGLIDRAAMLTGKNRTDFVLEAARRAARRPRRRYTAHSRHGRPRDLRPSQGVLSGDRLRSLAGGANADDAHGHARGYPISAGASSQPGDRPASLTSSINRTSAALLYPSGDGRLAALNPGPDLSGACKNAVKGWSGLGGGDHHRG